MAPASGPLATPGIRMRELRADGLRTRVLETGAVQAREAVVFLHGSPGSADDWLDLLPRAGELTRSVAFDLPGFGEAEKPRDWDYAPASFASFIAAALDGLGIELAHLVMSDIGGVGVFWAAAHPEAFAGAVMIDTGAFVGYRWHWVARLHRAPIVGRVVALMSRPALGAVMRIYDRAPRKLPAAVIDRWRGTYDWGSRRAMLRFYRSAPPATFERVVPALRRLDRPALVLWGAHDRFVPVVQAQRQRESFPSAEVVVFERSGHFPHLDDAEGVAAVVIPFLEARLGLRQVGGSRPAGPDPRGLLGSPSVQLP
jgi:pimeloyl-ACP methyl ester carboxylesterase